MSQPPQTPQNASPLTARLYDLEYPRSLGVYSTYQEVQSVVDTLADRQFPVQSTLIVGTDLKLMERVTGRRTWPRVISQGVLSGLWMGLFFGLLLLLITPGNLMIVLTSILMGIVFFTVWSVMGYAMTGGKRDFTSMTATIPMQYELLVEHKHADQARRILAETGAVPARPVPAAPAPGYPQSAPGQPSPGQHAHGQYGAPASPVQPGQPDPGQQAPQQQGHGRPWQQAMAPAPQQEQSTPSQGTAEEASRPHRPSYGQPATPAAPPAAAGEGAPHARPTYGQPAPTSPSAGDQDRGAEG
ncbi:general stress protein [Brachybacterium sp. YJGR34]|uniref:general stress protein n=1 Tax=Brachybacterium sp. YJGR34 TaxID=2059911 RepID=UPI001E5517F8|nr:general stress protein [Brachybacterium sp. YJGR34]